MLCVNTIREGTRVIAIIAVALGLWCGLFAPLLLFLGVLYIVAVLLLFSAERKLDRARLIVAVICLAMLIAIYFAPLWIAEQTSKTPEDHLLLAERFASRGQLLVNSTKAQAHYRIAAKGGNVEAEARLGEAILFWHYGTMNRDEGIQWLQAAAAHGHLKAQELLTSLGVKKSRE